MENPNKYIADGDLNEIAQLFQDDKSYFTINVLIFVLSHPNLVKKSNLGVELISLKAILEKARKVENQEEIVRFNLNALKKVFLIPYSMDNRNWSLMVYYKDSNVCKHYHPFDLFWNAKAKIFFEQAIVENVQFEESLHPLFENIYDCGPFMINLINAIFSKENILPLGIDEINKAKTEKDISQIRLYSPIFFHQEYPFMKSASLLDETISKNVLNIGSTFGGNKVKFLLDGEDFFKELKIQFEEVKKLENKADRNTFVRLAYWGANLDLLWYRPAEEVLGEQSTLADELKKVANAGVETKIILWYPSTLVSFVGNFLTVPNKKSHDAFYDELNGYNNGIIKVFREVYKGGITSSTHQKMAIFSIKGKLRVIIGGMNLDSWYWDKEGHNFEAEFQDSGYGGSCHDTGVLIEGPATLAVEHEWMRRWSKQGEKETKIPRPLYINQLLPTVEGSSEITIATTNSETKPAIRDIQRLLIQKIRAANNYVYIEGYMLSAPSLINVLNEKLTQVNFKLIVMIPHPSIGINHNIPDLKVLGYLNYVSYVRIAFLSCSAVTINIGGQNLLKLNRVDCSQWRIVEGDDKKWFTDTQIHCEKQDGGKVFRALFKDIDAFEGGARFYSPARHIGGNQRYIYIHSKLMLIDDEIAIIGSSNFTFRSMIYDGEIAACIEDANVVTNQIRNRLFAEFGMVNANGWDASAVASDDNTPGIKVVRLEPKDFGVLKELPKSKKTDYTSHEFY